MARESPVTAGSTDPQPLPAGADTADSGRVLREVELARLHRELDAQIAHFRARLDALREGQNPSGSPAAPPPASANGQPDEVDARLMALRRSLELRFEELGKLTRMLANCEKELETANRERVAQRIELQAMKKSLSWRATAALRYVVRQARRLGDLRSGEDAALLRTSDLFDAAWYLDRYPDVALRGMDPVRHYLEIGAREGRDPSAGFDTDWYLERNPDVAQAGINPLVHFIRHGEAEWRLPKP